MNRKNESTNREGRRSFLKKVAVAGTAATVGFPFFAKHASAAPVNIKMQSMWDAGTVGYLEFEKFAKNVGEMSEGKLVVKAFPAGSIVGTFEMFESVKTGVLAFTEPSTQFHNYYFRLSYRRPVFERRILVELAPGASVPPEVVRRFAFSLMHRIDRNLVVTPYHLVSFALVTHRRRGIEHGLLLERIGALVVDLAAREAVLSDLVLDALRSGGLWPLPPDATPAAVGACLVAEIDAIRSAHDKETVAVFSHSDPIKMAVAHYLGLPLDFYQRLSIGPASVTAFALTPFGPRLLVLNAGESLPSLKIEDQEPEDEEQQHAIPGV